MPGLNLTRAEAEKRAELLHVHSYDIDLDLTTGDKVFRGRTTIDFDAKEGASTFVDLVAAKVHSAVLNGQDISPDLYQDYRLLLHEHGRGPAQERRPCRRGRLPVFPV